MNPSSYLAPSENQLLPSSDVLIIENNTVRTVSAIQWICSRLTLQQLRARELFLYCVIALMLLGHKLYAQLMLSKI